MLADHGPEPGRTLGDGLARRCPRIVATADRALDALGLLRNVGLVVPNLLVVPHGTARTDLRFTSSRQVPAPLTRTRPLELGQPLIARPSVPVAAPWHERYGADRGHRWFHRRVSDVVGRDMGDPPQSP